MGVNKNMKQNRAVLLNFQDNRVDAISSPIWHQVDARLMLIMLLESERMHFENLNKNELCCSISKKTICLKLMQTS